MLNPYGHIFPGYSTREVLTYNKQDARAPRVRQKEWDFYQVSDHERCIQFTIGHAGYAGQIGVTYFDIRNHSFRVDKSVLLPLAVKVPKMPGSAIQDGVLAYRKGDTVVKFEVSGDERFLYARWDDLEVSVILRRETPHHIAVNIPFRENRLAYYYNQKINCMRADGWVRTKGESYRFSPKDAWGLLDWGRGVWPFHNEWFWSNGSGELDGQLFGFNLGCGFGNTSRVTENILFVGQKYYKLGQVTIEHREDFMEPWTLRDEEGRLDLTLTPIYDRVTSIKLLFVDNVCHQVFGNFSGRFAAEDGSVLSIDGITAFAEHAVNNW